MQQSDDPLRHNGIHLWAKMILQYKEYKPGAFKLEESSPLREKIGF